MNSNTVVEHLHYVGRSLGHGQSSLAIRIGLFLPVGDYWIGCRNVNAVFRAFFEQSASAYDLPVTRKEVTGMDKQDEYVLRTVEERGIRFVLPVVHRRLGVSQVGFDQSRRTRGRLRGRNDSSTVRRSMASARIQEADMIARPDPSTFQILPWRPDHARSASMFCDILTTDGEPFEGDPRWVLKRNLPQAADLGFTLLRRAGTRVLLLRGHLTGAEST